MDNKKEIEIINEEMPEEFYEMMDKVASKTKFITTTITLREDQKEFIDKHFIILSKFVQSHLDDFILGGELNEKDSD